MTLYDSMNYLLTPVSDCDKFTSFQQNYFPHKNFNGQKKPLEVFKFHRKTDVPESFNKIAGLSPVAF